MSKLNCFDIGAYVPRALRFQTPSHPSPLNFTIESEQTVMLSNGVVAPLREALPAHELIGKYKDEDFNLHSLLEAGVKLDVVNISRPQSKEISEINSIAGKVDALERYAKYLDAQKASVDALFSVDSSNVEQNNN